MTHYLARTEQYERNPIYSFDLRFSVAPHWSFKISSVWQPTNTISRTFPLLSLTGSIHLKEEMHNITYNPQDESVRFLCDIVGQPIPNITWYRGNKRIRPDDARGKFRIKPKLWGSV